MSGINILGGRVILPGKSEGEITHLHVSGERIAYVGKADPLSTLAYSPPTSRRSALAELPAPR